jgi:hypothetical protein
MPLDGRPLSASEIDIFRRWINEGAQPDSAVLPGCVQTVRAVLPQGRALHVACHLKGRRVPDHDGA